MYHLYLMNIVDDKIGTIRGFRLRDPQKIAVLSVLNSKENDNTLNGILQQVSTGEGKTLIIATVSIILVLMKLKVNIVTSSNVLAKMEIESQHGCMDLFEAFGIKAGHICHELLRKRISVYKTCDIIYGDLTTFQSDYLQHNFLSKNILGSRSFDVIIVDEVDSMLLDNGLNMLYLAHNVAELELLQPILTKIWQMVNFRKKALLQHDDEATFFQNVYTCFFPTLFWNDLSFSLNIDSDEAEKLKNILITKKIVDAQGNILVTNWQEIKRELRHVHNLKDTTKARFLCLINDIVKEQYFHVPRSLHEYVILHLKELIENAQIAFNMKEGISYQIETAINLQKNKVETRIVITDPDTGVDLPSTQWSKGLHQFLQLKHGLCLTGVPTKAVYISNVSFFKKFSFICGFTGTLGTEHEKNMLKELYNVKCKIMPSSFNRRFYEIQPVIKKSEDEYYKQIFIVLKDLMEKNRAALVIADSVKLVSEISKKINHMAKESLIGEEQNPFENAVIYKRGAERFLYADGNVPLPPRTIIFATNLAGRGTDIKISDDLKENGGMHVIVTFLPQNLRIQRQAFGRAARRGEPGTAQLIIMDENVKNNTEAEFIDLKSSRNLIEKQKVNQVKKLYEQKIKVEEECFTMFGKVFEELKKEMQKAHIKPSYKEILLKDFMDQYAMALDANISNNMNQCLSDIEMFCDHMRKSFHDTGMQPQRPSNIMKYASRLVSLILYSFSIKGKNIKF
uniref:Chloroplast protein-transporting ATPase n=1 Tax=Panagrolaimus davidi TaxID=227884 RepID=A0A914P5A1_9BILA